MRVSSQFGIDEFYKQIEERKRQGKKDNPGCYFFVPPATNSKFTPFLSWLPVSRAIAGNKKKKKPAANPARGFATTSIASKLRPEVSDSEAKPLAAAQSDGYAVYISHL
ncbi:hypothetical protein E5D57_006904 [Metarhizium anisopliae]|nr:hypothetical protein E5D57_006904 [Metarhizium anisopliae]